MGTRHGPLKDDRKTRFTVEERRAKHLRKAKKFQDAGNARKKERKKAATAKRVASLSELESILFPSEASKDLK